MQRIVRASLLVLMLTFCLLSTRLSAQVAYVVNLNDPGTGVTKNTINSSNGVLTIVPGSGVTAG